jgi:hypothetical protein
MVDIMNRQTATPLYIEAKQLAGLVSDEWQDTFNTETQQAELCLRDNLTGEIFPIAIIKPECSYDDRRLMARAPLIVRALLFLLRESFKEIERLKPKQKANKLAQDCAIYCGRQDFRRFLTECHDMVDATDNERVNTRVRNILDIQSRAELDKDQDAGKRWLSLKNAFFRWKGQ